jgi:hypothetical protein
MPDESDRGLRIIASKQRLAISAELFARNNPQASLFGEDEWLIVFINVSEINADDFAKAIMYAEPCVVLDLRLAPRFDVGSLNRERVFELFHAAKTTYVDATTPLLNGDGREAAIQRILRHIPIDGVSGRKTVVFLVGRNDNSSIASRSEMLSLLGQSDKRLDVVNIPELASVSGSLLMPEGSHKLRSVG